eukprot:gnl/MRDRNA2_/MRDRNA2_62274_c0_seq1.p1 gnl/MRDRNA2_/MRDRNA2_62274_c0~~gnl/MRDRNA2_/MRDRNA2_62274_c0_seq1.p1  ORF type:complete len:328 (-),score=42.65 gnl/MRDRNA2_/MRDRNA2_62274_c0_seq1:102-1085(-)
MHVLFVIVPLAILARAHNEEPPDSFMQISADDLVDMMVDRTLAQPRYSANLEDTTLAKTMTGRSHGMASMNYASARHAGYAVPLSKTSVPKSPALFHRGTFPAGEPLRVPIIRHRSTSQAHANPGRDLQNELAIPKAGAVQIRMGQKCRLQISVLPEFQYDAGCGGGGRGTATPAPLPGMPNRLALDLDPSTITIPPPPPPPGVTITTRPSRFAGTLDADSGNIELRFEAKYYVEGPFGLQKTLQVEATLMTQGDKGRKLDAEGSASLAGVARVPETGDALVDKLLLLPSEIAVVFEAVFKFPGPAKEGEAKPLKTILKRETAYRGR